VLDSGPDNEGWCKVRVTVDSPDRSWSGACRCLLSEEVTRLADWLEKSAAGSFDTLDNELGFELLGATPLVLRVFLNWSLRPDQERDKWACGGFYRDYPVSGKGLQRAAASLREQLRRATKGRPAR
jgi:hypothetical protein